MIKKKYELTEKEYRCWTVFMRLATLFSAGDNAANRRFLAPRAAMVYAVLAADAVHMDRTENGFVITIPKKRRANHETD